MTDSKTVMITGAAGYIGGQTMLTLKAAGHQVIAVDRRPVPDHLKGIADRDIVAEFSSPQIFSEIERETPNVIIHCAGTSLVGPSIQHPQLYYENNFGKTKNLVQFLRDRCMLSHTRLVFSSSAAVYGEPVMVPCKESDPPMPLSPYGESKLMTEMMLQSYRKAYGLDFVAFRYFNACGADSQARHGQESKATHIIARVLESLKHNKEFVLNGNDYTTADGTCVRDYVHVEDIALAHQMAMYDVVPAGIYNLGTSVGASNLEIMQAAESITDRTLRMTVGARRPGDPAVLTASSDKFNLITGWVPRHNLHEIIQHAWNWYQR